MVGKLPWDYPMRVFFEASKVVSEHIGRKRINGLDLDDLLLSIVSMCLYPFQAMPTRDTKLTSFIQRHKRHVSAVVVRAVGGKTWASRRSSLVFSAAPTTLSLERSCFLHRPSSFIECAPIGIFNQHYAIDLGSFLLPLGVFLLLAVRYTEWCQPIIGVAAFGSSLHLLSHLQDGFYSTRAVIADVFFLVVALLLIALLVIKKGSSDE
jgi:hypothetical protein